MKGGTHRGIAPTLAPLATVKLADGSVIRIAPARAGYVVVVERCSGARDWVQGLTPGEARAIADALHAAAEAVRPARGRKRGAS